MRWTMPATRAPLHSQRASRVIAALTVIATTFAMHAMVRRASRQLKMPRPDAYMAPACRHRLTTSAICTRPTVVTRASRRTLTLRIEERRARFVRLLFQSLHRDNLRPNQATLASRFRRRRTISVAGLLLDGKSSMTSGSPGAPTTARFPHASRCSKAQQGKWPGTQPRPSKMPRTR